MSAPELAASKLARGSLTRHPAPWLVCPAAVLLILLSSFPASGEAATPSESMLAVARLKAYLYDRFDEHAGHWEAMYSHASGGEGAMTALVLHSLLASGESSQHPKIARGLEYLKSVKTDRTYGLALRCMVWARLSQEYLPLLQRDAALLLLQADEEGQFDYGPRPARPLPGVKPRHDHSCSHYAALALAEAARRGVPVPESFWQATAEHWIRQQRPDGGWAYEDESDELAYGSMTAAGATVLLLAQQNLHRIRMAPEPRLMNAIDAAHRWLDRHFDQHRNPVRGGHTTYYLLAIERAALASGRVRYHQQDWFLAGARHLLSLQKADGSIDGLPYDTPMALLFLARGLEPVWVSKVQLPDQPWNLRPHDLHFLSYFLSQSYEREFHWQSLELSALGSAATPVLYLASDQAVKLTAQQEQSLKEYLDAGGLLLASPDNGSQPFVNSVQELGQRLYPHLAFEPLDPSHPAMSLMHPVNGRAATQVLTLSNQARDLILLATQDYGFDFQADPWESQGPSVALKVGANVFALATDRGKIASRIEAPPAEPAAVSEGAEGGAVAASGDALRQRVIGRCTAFKGQPAPEPWAWELLARHLRQHAGTELRVEAVELEELGQCRLPMVHLSGVKGMELTQAQRRAMLDYARAGGTLLVETIGGRGDFASSVEQSLAKDLGYGATPLSLEDAVVSGRGFAGGVDVSQAAMRGTTRLERSLGPGLAVAALRIGGRPAILLTREDLTLGLLGLRRWGIMGYMPEASRDIVSNIVLSGEAPR